VDNPPTDHDNSSKGKKRSHSTESPSHDTRSSTAKDDSSTGRRRRMMLVNPIELIVLVMMVGIQKIRAAVIRLPHYLVILMMARHRHQI
jgi:hypothetical protein